MLPKEFKIQENLGHIQKYTGYIKLNGTDNYIVFTVKSPTYKSARIRLKNICKRHIDEGYVLDHIYKPGEVLPTDITVIDRIETTI